MRKLLSGITWLIVSHKGALYYVQSELMCVKPIILKINFALNVP